MHAITNGALTVAFTVTVGSCVTASVPSAYGSAPPAAAPGGSAAASAALLLTSMTAPSEKAAYVTTSAEESSQLSLCCASQARVLALSGAQAGGVDDDALAPRATRPAPVVASAVRRTKQTGSLLTVMVARADALAGVVMTALPGRTPCVHAAQEQQVHARVTRAAVHSAHQHQQLCAAAQRSSRARTLTMLPDTCATLLLLLANDASAVTSAPASTSPAAAPPFVQSARSRSCVAWKPSMHDALSWLASALMGSTLLSVASSALRDRLAGAHTLTDTCAHGSCTTPEAPVGNPWRWWE